MLSWNKLVSFLPHWWFCTVYPVVSTPDSYTLATTLLTIFRPMQMSPGLCPHPTIPATGSPVVAA